MSAKKKKSANSATASTSTHRPTSKSTAKSSPTSSSAPSRKGTKVTTNINGNGRPKRALTKAIKTKRGSTTTQTTAPRRGVDDLPLFQFQAPTTEASTEMHAPKETMELNLNLKVPAGSAVTICHNNNGSNIGGTNHTPNTHTAPQPQPQSHASMLRELGKLNREQLRKALTNARLNAAALINLSSALHGSLYPLVAIGGKVAKR